MRGGGTLGGRRGIFLNFRSYFTEKATRKKYLGYHLCFRGAPKAVGGGGAKKEPNLFFLGAQKILVVENKFYRGWHTGMFCHCLCNRGRSMVDLAAEQGSTAPYWIALYHVAIPTDVSLLSLVRGEARQVFNIWQELLYMFVNVYCMCWNCEKSWTKS